MSSWTRTDTTVPLAVAAHPHPTSRRLGPLDVFILSLCCGLAAGLLEVAARVLPRSIDSSYRLHSVSRHFIWLVPLTNLLVFAAIGIVFALLSQRWPRPMRWLSPRLLCALALLPMFIVGGPQIYAEAWFVLCLGIAAVVVPILERDVKRLRSWLQQTFPCLLVLVLILAGFTFGRDWLKERREANRPLPAADAPNVLLIVLDTVRFDHMSLYGYARATTPNLDRLAAQAIRFDRARATAPWTLASHASMFTGRWPHELAVKWLSPLSGKFSTLAEYLGSHGYSTAGFVANTLYCSYDTGLDQGFTHYEDFDLERLGPFRMAQLVGITSQTFAALVQKLSDNFATGAVAESLLGQLRVADKKHAGLVNREFLDWLSRRPNPRRPFFAFLNYFDAHSPYVLPRGAQYRFGQRPRTGADFKFLEFWGDVDKARLQKRHQTFIVDCYDNCISYLDERLGELFGELQRRGVLEETLLVVTADHGEGLGEHGLFDHGESLYGSEIRVPLLIRLPAQPVSSSGSRNRQSARSAGDHNRSGRTGCSLGVSGSFARRARQGERRCPNFRIGLRGLIRARSEQSRQSQSGSITGRSWPARLTRRRRSRLHPQRTRWNRRIIRRARRSR